MDRRKFIRQTSALASIPLLSGSEVSSQTETLPDVELINFKSRLLDGSELRQQFYKRCSKEQIDNAIEEFNNRNEKKSKDGFIVDADKKIHLLCKSSEPKVIGSIGEIYRHNDIIYGKIHDIDNEININDFQMVLGCHFFHVDIYDRNKNYLVFNKVLAVEKS